MNPGRFAIPLGDDNYYDSLRHKICKAKDLERRSLLSGDEERAIYSRLLEPGKFQLMLIPSFECNLRCPQCYVGHLLAKPSGNRRGSTDSEKLISFVGRAKSTLGSLMDLAIVGGEPFLHPDAFREYLNAGLPVSTTTNGMFDFEEVKDVIGCLDHITFSIDGGAEQHNRTRKSLNGEVNPFFIAYRNLCITVATFPGLDVHVQGSIIDDESANSNEALKYFTLMLLAGVNRRRIRLGPPAATLRRLSTATYLKTIPTYSRKTPCCDHLMHKGFYVFNNAIYASYHMFEESDPLGTLDDSIQDILAKKADFIMRTMPLLRDNVCMKECKAVGVCWGMCTSHRHVFVEGKPSSVCDRQFKESRLLEIAHQAGSRGNREAPRI